MSSGLALTSTAPTATMSPESRPLPSTYNVPRHPFLQLPRFLLPVHPPLHGRPHTCTTSVPDFNPQAQDPALLMHIQDAELLFNLSRALGSFHFSSLTFDSLTFHPDHTSSYIFTTAYSNIRTLRGPCLDLPWRSLVFTAPNARCQMPCEPRPLNHRHR